MDQNQVMKQVIDFQKAAFDNAYSAMTTAQDRTEKMTDSFMNQAFWIPENVKDACSTWTKTYHEGCETFKKTVDDNFEKMGDYIK